MKKITHVISEVFWSLLFWTSLVGMCGSITVFYIGFHNLDYSSNMNTLFLKEGIPENKYHDISTYNPCGYTEQNVSSTAYTYAQGYILGGTQMMKAFWMFGLSSLLLGISLNQFEFKGDKNTKTIRD